MIDALIAIVGIITMGCLLIALGVAAVLLIGTYLSLKLRGDD